MAGKDKWKKPRRAQKKKRTQEQAEVSGRSKHPEQKRAEQEEERTLQEKELGAPEAAESTPRERPIAEGEQAKEPEARERIHGVMKEGEFPIVAIGASAGGLQALEAFFGALPADSGLGFVVITHTAPEHKSMLPELIRRKSRIPVKLIEDGMTPEPDTVYLSPSDRDAFLERRAFRLRERPARAEIHMPVDLFLKHLAEDRGEFSACAILSGTGTDGTLGLRLIKEKAGVAVAQRPDSARHTGMPQSAIETGLVDYVLPPAEMPERLVQYFRHPAAMRSRDEGGNKKEPDALRRILNFLANRTRHDFSHYKENTLIRRIERRMTITRSRKAFDYLELLQREPEEVRTLFQDLLIGVTNFFRDP
jgi:two-component system CheB/CheR fusion protein